MWIETVVVNRGVGMQDGFTRLKWRVWIETLPSCARITRPIGSPVLNGGCGLKLLLWPREWLHLGGFTRLKWRVWIETCMR